MSSGPLKWPVWIAWALPYEALTLSVQASLPHVLGKLQALAIGGIRYGERNSLDGYEYKVRSLPQGVRILGPFGNRRWVLVAHVTVLPNVSKESPVTLAIATRLEKRMWLQVAFGSLLFVGLCTWIFQDLENPIQTFGTALFVMAILGYGIGLLALSLETNILVQLLKQRLG